MPYCRDIAGRSAHASELSDPVGRPGFARVGRTGVLTARGAWRDPRPGAGADPWPVPLPEARKAANGRLSPRTPGSRTLTAAWYPGPRSPAT
ncbi:hypothetical protein [Lysobacter gummosus]|uniref:hypothetical protein n=1 Tax=Lysobacter gummosus TaxID=262324 RepID=UPI00363B9FCF